MKRLTFAPRCHRWWSSMLLGLVVAAAGCSGEVEQKVSKPLRPAKLIKLTTASDVRAMSFPAVIEARATTDLAFQVGGRLQELNVREGQEVKRGMVIARLDQTKLRNDVATAQAQYDSAESEFQRAKRLIAENAIAHNVYEQRKSQRDVASSALDNARKTLDDSAIRSPFAGAIAKVHTERYQNVQPAEPIVTLQTTGAAEAVVEIPARLVANSDRIKPSETVVILDAAPGIRSQAVFASATGQANPETQTFSVKFAFTPPENLKILPGMTGRVESKLSIAERDGSTQRLSLKVPLAAILSDGDARYVWVVDEKSMTVSRRQVKLAAGVGEALAVLDGLKPGEVIVGAGASYLHEGMQISRFEQ